jgi:cytochrome c553
MTVIAKLFSLQTIAMTIAMTNAGAALAAEPAAPSKQEFDTKVQYCKTCHGLKGEGFRGASTMPRLAGQQPEYVENQLRAFDERRRQNAIMFNVSHALSPGMLAALAKHFKDLDPKPLGGAPKDLVPAGKKIYEEGVASTDIPPCASCHGPQAKGEGQFPRLAGQLHDYIFKKLTNWNTERGQDAKNPDSSAIMQPIAHGLTEAQVSAVAAYLSTLE